jgi:hypothetical protein
MDKKMEMETKTKTKTDHMGKSGGQEQSDSEPPVGGHLHVIFHGSFCFFDDGESKAIQVRVPKVVDEKGTEMMGAHAYIAGNWLNERTFMPDMKFELKGVETGEARFDPEKNLYLNGAIFAEAPVNLYASITLPRPDRIDSLQRGQIEQEAFEGDETALAMVKGVSEVATVQVFTYRFSDATKLSLEPHSPLAFSGEGRLARGFCSLHLFAEPDETPDADHPHHALRSAMSMFTDADGKPFKLNIQDKKAPEIQSIPEQEVPFGTISAELEDLPKRIKRLSALGIMRLKNEDLNDIFDDNDALGGDDPLDCISPIGGGGPH